MLKIKTLIGFMILNFIVMVVMPAAVVTAASPQSGMIFTMLLFFIVNPFFVVCVGVFAGKQIKKRWFLPIIPSGLFFISSWFIFSMGELAFVIYAGGYLFLSTAAMAFCWWIEFKMKNRR